MKKKPKKQNKTTTTKKNKKKKKQKKKTKLSKTPLETWKSTISCSQFLFWVFLMKKNWDKYNSEKVIIGSEQR